MATQRFFYENVLRGVEVLDISVHKISLGIQRNSSTLTSYFLRKNTNALPHESVINDVAHFFGVAPEDLIGRKLEDNEFKMHPYPANYKQMVSLIGTVPLYSAYDLIALASGKRCDIKRFTSPPDMDFYYPTSKLFAYDVIGLAYPPRICHGDIVYAYSYEEDLMIEHGRLVIAYTATPQPAILFGKAMVDVVTGITIEVIGSNEERRLIPFDSVKVLGIVAATCTHYM